MSELPKPAVLPSCTNASFEGITLPATAPEAARGEYPPGPTTLEIRVQQATARGGLENVPGEYADGDWQTIQSASLFDRLYLDGFQWKTIDPCVIQRNYEVLRRFWEEKISLLQQGSAETQILQRYGGADRNRNLVLKYPGRLQEAFERLRTREGIDNYVREVDAERLDRARPALQTILAVMFADGVVEPSETWRFFDAAAAQGVSSDQAASLLDEGFQKNGWGTAENQIGRSRAEQLASVTWTNRSIHAPEVQTTASAEPMVPPRQTVRPGQTSPPAAQPQTRPPYSMVTIASIAAALLLAVFAVAALFVQSRVPPPVESPTHSTPAVDEISPTSSTAEVAAAPPVAGAATPVQVAGAEVVRAAPSEPAVSASQRDRVADQLRDVHDRSVSDPAAALEEIAALELELSGHPQEYASERVTLVTLREQLKASIALAEQKRQSEIDAATHVEQMQQAQWEKRIEGIEDLMRSGNFSGAEKLASELIKEPDVPETVAARARELGDEAFASLQSSWAKAKVTSKTRKAGSRR